MGHLAGEWLCGETVEKKDCIPLHDRQPEYMVKSDNRSLRHTLGVCLTSEGLNAGDMMIISILVYKTIDFRRIF